MDRQEARRRYEHPGVQRRLAHIKERDWDENTLPASAVFAQRLRETRKERGYTLAELERRMKLNGNPISKSALQLIELGRRGLSLDEALALTEVLQAVPANMLIPPSGKLVRLSEGLAVEGSDMRRWLSSGLPFRSKQAPAKELRADVLKEESDRRIARLAQNLVDTLRVGGDDSGKSIREIVQEIGRELSARPTT